MPTTCPISFAELIAFHEAGHAAAAFSLGRGPTVIDLSIIPQEDTAGRVHFTRLDSGGAERFHGSDPMTTVTVLLAGPIAEAARAEGVLTYDVRATDDWTRSVAVAAHAFGDHSRAGRYVEWAWDLTASKVTAPGLWAGVTAIAWELLECRRIDGGRAWHVYQAAVRR